MYLDMCILGVYHQCILRLRMCIRPICGHAAFSAYLYRPCGHAESSACAYRQPNLHQGNPLNTARSTCAYTHRHLFDFSFQTPTQELNRNPPPGVTPSHCVGFANDSGRVPGAFHFQLSCRIPWYGILLSWGGAKFPSMIS